MTDHVGVHLDRLPEELVVLVICRGSPVPGPRRDRWVMWDPRPQVIERDRERCTDRRAISSRRVRETAE